MRDFLISKGWQFIGYCGCTPKMAIYKHASHPGRYFYLGTHNWQFKEDAGRLRRTSLSGAEGSLQNQYNTKFPDEITANT